MFHVEHHKNNSYDHRSYDVIVVGGGHAGCEAALAAARMGASTLLITINIFTLAQMSCNPAIGGLAKGHLVKEIDAMGGEMGYNADRTAIQFKMLNRSKGPAVWSLRTQNDRLEYSSVMRQTLELTPNLFIRQHDIHGVLIDKEKATGVITEIGTKLYGKSIILANGTFLNGLIHIGLQHFDGGRSGELASRGLSGQLRQLGFKVGRLKTGTPPRLDGRTIDFDAMEEQSGDEVPTFFSHRSEIKDVEQKSCYITRTTTKTHDILRSGLDRSPLYSGIIKSIGPRYCPSVEDKIVRFPDKQTHQLFLEPEGKTTHEYYLNGFATSLPEDIQLQAVHSVPGLEHAQLTRLGYAIEYDFFPPSQLKATLETKRIQNLYFVGQINGTSGYEEAAAQGFIAGVNAVLKQREESPLTLNRSEAYIGVLIDDLITKEVLEPYRMFTSRAEYRLILRQDNADLRLMDYGYRLGLISASIHSDLLKRRETIKESLTFLRKEKPKLEDINPILEKIGSSPLKQPESLEQVLKRPEIGLFHFSGLSRHPLLRDEGSVFWEKVREQVDIEIKYQGFLSRQKAQVEKMHQLEHLAIPEKMDYSKLNSISTEAREKLTRFQPQTLGQASRILGVSPSDIAVLMMWLSRKSSRKNVSRGTLDE